MQAISVPKVMNFTKSVLKAMKSRRESCANDEMSCANDKINSLGGESKAREEGKRHRATT
jgi:hypothetical protein